MSEAGLGSLHWYTLLLLLLLQAPDLQLVLFCAAQVGASVQPCSRL